MRPITVRLPVVVLGAALSAPLAFGGIALAPVPAGAAPLVAPTSCGSLKGTAASTAALAGCTAATTGGTGTIAGTGPNTDTVTWKNGGTTTFTYRYVLVKPDLCAKGSSEYSWSGTVTASTGPASRVTGKITALVCLSNGPARLAHLLPGTRWVF